MLTFMHIKGSAACAYAYFIVWTRLYVAGRSLKNNSNLKTYFRIMQFRFIFTLFQVNYRSPCIHLYIWENERKNSEKNSHIHTLPLFEASLRLTRAIMDSTHSSFKEACQMIVKQIVTNDKHSSYSSDLSSCKTFNWVYTRKHLIRPRLH